MKIIVTGASGFLGRHLCPFLENQGHEVIKLDSKNCDLTASDSLNRFNQNLCDRIYHLAHFSRAGDFSIHHRGEQWIVNQQINTNTLAWWQKYQPQAKLISFGTSLSYNPNIKHIEENYLVDVPSEGYHSYAMTKRMLYEGLLALNSQFYLKYLHFIPSTLYGPNYHTDGRQMHFIFDLIRKILRGKLHGEPVVLWGDGYQKRELVFVNDLVEIITRLANELDNELINIGEGEEHTIREFAKIICEKVGYDPDLIQYDTSKFVGARSKFLDIAKFKKFIPDFKRTPLEDGLSETIDWFLENKEKLLGK